jgi:hypothetical protein
MACLEKLVHQAAVGALDRDRKGRRILQLPQPAHELLEPFGAVGDGERGQPVATIVKHADGVLLRSPVDPCEHPHHLRSAGCSFAR